MTKTLTIRLAASELALCDKRAKELGVTRTDYVRSRLFDSSGATGKKEKRNFASRELVGSLAIGRGSTNEKVRAALQKRNAAASVRPGSPP